MEWKVEKGRHFMVYYTENAALARRVAHAAERAYERIMRDLAFRKFTDFWTWDDRARIYVYPTFRAFRDVTGAPPWARAKASYDRKSMFVVARDGELLGATLPHELAHLVFRDFLGFQQQAPAWLHEGIAQRQEADRAADALRIARAAAARGRLIPLSALTSLSVQDAAARGEAPLFYAQAVSVVSFMIDRYGATRFRAFCERLKDGKPLPEALRFTYGGSIDTIEALEREWLKELAPARRKP